MVWESLLLVAILVGIVVIVGLVKWYLPSYLNEKAKNLATKEDVGAITREVERVRHEYAERLESLAHQNRVILEQGNRRHQLRMAALDRRLDVHQQAYTLWVTLVGSAQILRESWDTIMRVGELLVKAVELPPIAGVDSAIDDRRGPRSASQETAHGAE